MPSPLTVKRRRLNESTSTLAKPFVSPLKARKGEGTPLKPTNPTYQPSRLAHKMTAIPPTEEAAQFTLSKAPSTIPATPTPIRKHPTHTTKRTSPAEIAAQKTLTTLELRIRALRNDLDALAQASQISTSTTDTTLSSLSQKWKLASQAAAEEIFGSVKERVCRMGGVAAWRESEKSKFERARGLGEFREVEGEAEGDDKDCEFDSQGEELPEEEQVYRKREKARVRREMREVGEVEVEVAGEEEGGGGKTKMAWQEGGGDDDAFTMDMMLRSLNIELKVIGYDKVGQRWRT